jgi:phenylalanine-4-hydroxylase
MNNHTYISKELNNHGEIEWSDQENKTWNILITRQLKTLKNRCCPEFLEGLKLINFPHDRVPQHKEINKTLQVLTGWQVIPVPAVIGAEEFFTLLATRKFPAASFIRIPEELDYIQEPDIFHEFFGHLPLLTDQRYADFLEEFGKLALSIEAKWRSRLFRLFWFTIEFGLVKHEGQLKSYGGGILSSVGETVYSLEQESVIRVKFDIMTTLRTPYRRDIMQPQYFVLEKYSDLFEILKEDVASLLPKAKKAGDFKALFGELGEEL